jgi:hypothetical protein
LLPKQPSIATGKQPVRVKVLPTDTGRTSVVMAYDPTKDGLVFLTGYQTATDATTAHTAARLLQERLGLCYGYAALDHILTTPVDSSGAITQFYVLSLPLNILKQQYRTGPVAQRAIEAAAATHDLATNPRVVVQILPELREVTATAVPGSNPVRYRIPYGVLVPWDTLTFQMKHREAVSITVPEGSFTLEERKDAAFSALMGRYVRPDGLSRFMPAVPVSLPDSFQRALPKLESQARKSFSCIA